MPRPIKHSPEEITFLKRHIPDCILHGKTVAASLAGLGVTPKMLIRWRRDDIEFDRAMLAALAGSRAASSARRGEAGTRLLQSRLIEHIEAGERPTHAAANIGMSYRAVQHWTRTDPQFRKEFDEAVQALTHMELDRLADLHEEFDDSKMAMVAGRHLQSWIEKRNREEFGPKATGGEEAQPRLVDILEAAVKRLIDAVPVPAQPLTVVEQPKQLPSSKDDPAAIAERHRP